MDASLGPALFSACGIFLARVTRKTHGPVYISQNHVSKQVSLPKTGWETDCGFWFLYSWLIWGFFGLFFNNSLIEIFITYHTLHLLKVYNVMLFSMFFELCIHHHNQFKDICTTPKRNPVSLISHSSFPPPLPPALGNHYSTFWQCTFAFSERFIQTESGLSWLASFT